MKNNMKTTIMIFYIMLFSASNVFAASKILGGISFEGADFTDKSFCILISEPETNKDIFYSGYGCEKMGSKITYGTPYTLLVPKGHYLVRVMQNGKIIFRQKVFVTPEKVTRLSLEIPIIE